MLQGQWIGVTRAAAPPPPRPRRATAAWLDGRSAGAVACDATIIPVVTGQVDPAALDDLVGLCLQFAGHGPHCGSPQRADPAAQPAQTAEPGQTADRCGATGPAGGSDATDPAGDPARVGPQPPTPQALEMLRHAIAKAPSTSCP